MNNFIKSILSLLFVSSLFLISQVKASSFSLGIATNFYSKMNSDGNIQALEQQRKNFNSLMLNARFNVGIFHLGPYLNYRKFGNKIDPVKQPYIHNHKMDIKYLTYGIMAGFKFIENFNLYGLIGTGNGELECSNNSCKNFFNNQSKSKTKAIDLGAFVSFEINDQSAIELGWLSTNTNSVLLHATNPIDQKFYVDLDTYSFLIGYSYKF